MTTSRDRVYHRGCTQHGFRGSEFEDGKPWGNNWSNTWSAKGKGKGAYSGGKGGANIHELNPWAVSLGSLEYYGSSLNLLDVCDSDSGIFNWELLDASESIDEDIVYEKVDDDDEPLPLQ